MSKEKVNKKQLGKGKKIVLAVLGVILALILAAVIFLILNPVWWSHIKSAYILATNSSEDISGNINKVQEQTQNAISGAGLYIDNDVVRALNEGRITPEQMTSIMAHQLSLNRALAENIAKNKELSDEQRRQEISSAGLYIDDDVEKALKEGKLSDEQLTSIMTQELKLSEALAKNIVQDTQMSREEKREAVKEANLYIDDEVEKAYDEGKLSDEQMTSIMTEKIKLNEALAENIVQDTQMSDEEKREAAKEANLYIDDEVEKAFKDGELTTRQMTSIMTEKTTLQEIREQNKTQPNNNQQVNDKPAAGDKTTVKNDNPANSANRTPSKPQNEPTAQIKPGVTDNKVSDTPSADSSKVDQEIAALVTKMYVLKSNYIGQIDGLISSMKSEFIKLPAAQRTTSAKQSIASKYVSRINSMEAQCDAQVNSIVSELRALLKSAGRDMSLADSIMSTYASEKENTKAYYIATYGD